MNRICLPDCLASVVSFSVAFALSIETDAPFEFMETEPRKMACANFYKYHAPKHLEAMSIACDCERVRPKGKSKID
uniref:Uncharacterized protein n=1 Tax=Callorhinchus milii TaxID=7868 RepID=A0A4W3I8L8_CALMI